jgi:hypothetical protein
MPTPSPNSVGVKSAKGTSSTANSKRKTPKAKRDISMGFKKSGFSPAVDAFGKENNSPQGRSALNKPQKAGGLSVVVSAVPTQLRKRQLATVQPVKEPETTQPSPDVFTANFPLSPADSTASDEGKGCWSWIDSPGNSENGNSMSQSFKGDETSENFMAGGK